MIVVEGYTDVLACHQAGAQNTVAAMGTALTEDQIRLLARMGQTAVLVLDGDKGGVDAALRAGALARDAGLGVKIAILPADSDPADLIATDGPDRFAQLVDGAVSFSRFHVVTAIARADISTPEGKARTRSCMRCGPCSRTCHQAPSREPRGAPRRRDRVPRGHRRVLDARRLARAPAGRPGPDRGVPTEREQLHAAVATPRAARRSATRAVRPPAL